MRTETDDIMIRRKTQFTLELRNNSEIIRKYE